MTNNENEILISAYLDGELTAAEKSRVEQLLINDAEVRELLDELRAIRTRLQALPLHHLAPDFAQQVLDRARREVSDTAPADNIISPVHPFTPSPLHGAAASDSPSLSPVRRLTHVTKGSIKTNRRIPIFASRRSIIWSVATIAAAVVIVVTTRQNAPDRQLAQNVVPKPAATVESPVRTAGALAKDQGEQVAANQPQLTKVPADKADLNLPPSPAASPQSPAGSVAPPSANNQFDSDRIANEAQSVRQ